MTPIGAAHVIRLAASVLAALVYVLWGAVPASARQVDTASARQATIAVAANFTAAAKDIAAAFTAATGHDVRLSIGSTGQLYTQITQGAPFDVFLAADRLHPQKAVDAGYGIAEHRFTYATGRLVLYGKAAEMGDGEGTLKRGAFSKIAIANPETAPYGAAAVETMSALGIYDRLAAKIVKGNTLTQVYQFIETGNAEVGFVALSQVVGRSGTSVWMVPEQLYRPIAQDAVLLQRGAGNEAALAFVAFLRGSEAGRIASAHGYGTGE
ncbi:MAG: molybdate ABC transporter substrate-binding protein [Rhodospirillales bacterium]|nr:molybdate ABC transporter substrate-binding protein [Rhodospirillales bacterium]